MLTQILFRSTDVPHNVLAKARAHFKSATMTPGDLFLRFTEELLANYRELPTFARAKSDDGTKFFEAKADGRPGREVLFSPIAVGVLSKTDTNNVEQLIKSVEPALSLDDIYVKTSIFSSSSRQRQSSIVGTAPFLGKSRMIAQTAAAGAGAGTGLAAAAATSSAANPRSPLAASSAAGTSNIQRNNDDDSDSLDTLG